MIDKRVKVSVDYSDLYALQGEMRNLTFDWNKLQNGLFRVSPDQFQQYIERFTSIQDQVLKRIAPTDPQFRSFDAAWERFSSAYQGANPDWRSRLTPPPTPVTDRAADVGANQGLWGRITNFLGRIVGVLEDDRRDRKNGEVTVGGTPQSSGAATAASQKGGRKEEQPDTEESSGRKSGGFRRFPTDLGSILRGSAVGYAVYQLLKGLAGQVGFSTQQYRMEDDFARQINRGNNPIWNMLTFGISGAISDRRMAAYNTSRQFDRAVTGFNQLTGTSYDEGVAALYSYGGALGKRGSLVDSEAQEASVQAYNSMAYQSPTGTYWVSTAASGARPSIGEFGLGNWASRTLGMDVSEYLNSYTQLSRAGAFAKNASFDNIRQLLIGQRYRGLSDSDISSLQSVSRYGSYTGGDILNTLDTNLRRFASSNLGYSGIDVNRYVSSMLPEVIGAFSSMANSVLSVSGNYNAGDILSTMSSIQNATGAQGAQLERYQNALMGRGFGQDDVSQALALRTIGQMFPQETFSGTMEKLEKFRAGGDSELAKAVYENIVRTSNGNKEQLKQTLKAVFGENLSWEDVNDLVDSGKSPDQIFGSGSRRGTAYSDEQAARTLSRQEISAAESRNRLGYEGHERVYKMLGEDLKGAIDGSALAQKAIAYFDSMATKEQDIENFEDAKRVFRNFSTLEDRPVVVSSE